MDTLGKDWEGGKRFQKKEGTNVFKMVSMYTWKMRWKSEDTKS